MQSIDSDLVDLTQSANSAKHTGNHYLCEEVINFANLSIKDVETYLKEGEKKLQDREEIHRSRSMLIKNTFDECIKTMEQRKDSLLLELDELSESIKDSLKSDIKQCHKSINEINAYINAIKNIDCSTIDKLNLSQVLLKIKESIISTTNYEPKLFKINEITVDVSDQVISGNTTFITELASFGEVSQPSPALSRYSGIFIDDHFELELNTAASTGDDYSYGGLPISIDLFNRDTQIRLCTEDTHHIEISEELNGYYRLTITPTFFHKNVQIKVKLNDQLVTPPQIDWEVEILNRSDSQLINADNIKDGNKFLYFIDNNNIYVMLMHHDKIYNRYYELNDIIHKYVSIITDVCFTRSHLYVVDSSQNCVYKFAYDGQLIKKFDNSLYDKQIFDTPIKIFAKIGSYDIENDYFIVVNKINSDIKIVIVFEYTQKYNIILNDVDPEDANNDTSDIDIIAGEWTENYTQKLKQHGRNNDIIRIIKGKNKKRRSIMYYYPTSEYIMPWNLYANIRSFISLDKYIIIASDDSISVYNGECKKVCKINVKNKFDIIKVHDFRLYAIDKTANLLAVWDISIS